MTQQPLFPRSLCLLPALLWCAVDKCSLDAMWIDERQRLLCKKHGEEHRNRDKGDGDYFDPRDVAILGGDPSL